MNEFKTYHPLVMLIYFILMIGFTMLLMHPICLCASFLCAFIYSVMLKGSKAIRMNLLYMLPVMLVTALLNPAFNHEGVTILAYLPSGNPLTLESICYGLAAAVMLVSVIGWFCCYHELMTSDKLVYLFGRILPSLSLIISMTLRFVPEFAAQIRRVAAAQKCIGRDVSNGSVLQRARHGLHILSIMITWSLENAVVTADSMKSRGYGVPGRTAYSIFKFDKRDAIALGSMALLGIYIEVGYLLGGLRFYYFPSMQLALKSPYAISVLTAYGLLCLWPILLEIKEAKRWKALQSNI